MSDCLNDEELLIEENRMLEDANAELIERVKKLEEENRRLRDQLEDSWMNENKVAELAYVLHRIKRYSETEDVSERRIDKVIGDIISFDWKKELHLKKEQGDD